MPRLGATPLPHDQPSSRSVKCREWGARAELEPWCRRRGAGRSVGLMAAVCEQVARDHAPLVTLYVNEYNHPARALYARLGFRLVGPYATILM